MYDLCGGKTYDPTTQECLNDTTVVFFCNITYGDSLACLTADSLYVITQKGRAIAVDIGIRTESGKRTHIATSNLVVNRIGSAYIPNNPAYIPSTRYSTSTIPFEWDLFGFGDPTGKLTTDSLDKYPTVENIEGTKYDIAYVKLGGKWRLPTNSELAQLTSISSAVYTLSNTDGRLWTNSKLNTNLFIPFAGIRSGGTVSEANKVGALWSSTKNASFVTYAYGLLFDANTTTTRTYKRYYDLSVRPLLVLE